MATWYVNSAAAGSNNGTSWTNAFTTMAAAITASSAGDDFNVKSTHSESTAGVLTLTFKGTLASPNRVFSCGVTNSPAQDTDLLVGASIANTGSNIMTIEGVVYFYGVTLTSAFLIKTHTAAGGQIIFDNCALVCTATGGGISYNFGSPNNANETTILNNTTLSFSGTSQQIGITYGRLIWKNTASGLVGTPTVFNGLFSSPSGYTVSVLCDGVDLTNISSSADGYFKAQGGIFTGQLLNCKLKVSTPIIAGTPTSKDTYIEILNSDDGTKNYRHARYTYEAALITESTIVKSSGASDGTTPISWKVVTTTNNKRHSPFECFEIGQWVDTAGISKTATVDVVTDNITLTNADIWIEAQYMGSSATPIASLATSGTATVLTTGTNLTTSTATWTTTGLTTPAKQKMSITFTNQMNGYVRFTVKVAKASTTLYIDPNVVIV